MFQHSRVIGYFHYECDIVATLCVIGHWSHGSLTSLRDGRSHAPDQYVMLRTSCTLNYLIYSYENNIFITVSASRQTLGENLSDPASFFSIEKYTSGNLYKVSRLK